MPDMNYSISNECSSLMGISLTATIDLDCGDSLHLKFS